MNSVENIKLKRKVNTLEFLVNKFLSYLNENEIINGRYVCEK